MSDCENCPPVGVTFYQGKVWTCFVCGSKWRGNAVDAEPVVERVDGDAGE